MSIAALNNTFTPGTQVGTVNSSKNGNGVFERILSDTNGQKSINTQVTYDNGTTTDRVKTWNANGTVTITNSKDGTQTSQKTITQDGDGSETISITGKNGKTKTIDETVITNEDGTKTISGTITLANGNTETLAGTVSQIAGGRDKSITITKDDGKNAGEQKSVDRQRVVDGNVTTYSTTGTNFNGSSIDSNSTWTTV
jgi:hypothetical protein